MQKTVVAAALGECVHVAGVLNFLRLAESCWLAHGFPWSGSDNRRCLAHCSRMKMLTWLGFLTA